MDGAVLSDTWIDVGMALLMGDVSNEAATAAAELTMDGM